MINPFKRRKKPAFNPEQLRVLDRMIWDRINMNVDGEEPETEEDVEATHSRRKAEWFSHMNLPKK